MPDHTPEPYRRLYDPEAANTLWEALHDAHAHMADSTAPPPKPLPPELAPLPIQELERLHEQGVALLGCIVATYQALADVMHTAIGVELAAIKAVPLPAKPTHAAVVRDVGRGVDELVRQAVVKNAWRIMYYSGLRELVRSRRQDTARAADNTRNPRAEPGKAQRGALDREFYFGSPPPDMEDRYRLPSMREPVHKYGAYLDSLKPNPDGTTTVERIPTPIRPRPYAEALQVIGRRSQDATRLAAELEPRIADLFCTAARVELGLPATPDGEHTRADLYARLDELGQASAILYRQILEDTPNIADFKTLALAREMVTSGMLRPRPRRGKRRR
jgi:hypothetical protein